METNEYKKLILKGGEGMITKCKLTKIEPRLGVVGFFSCNYYDLHLESIAVKKKEDDTIYLMCPGKKVDNKVIQYYYPICSDLYNEILDEVLKMLNND